jgi:hypothetical protein
MSLLAITIKKQIVNRPIFWLLIIFCLVQVILYLKVGINTGLEAEKYIAQGNNLYDTGSFSASKYIFYLPVILLVYLCRLLGTSYHLVVVIQIILAGIAVVYFYKLCRQLGNPYTGFAASLLLITFFPLQLWNFHLYTESVFISLCIIYAYIVFYYGNKGIRGSVVILFFLTLLIFSRPHGLLFIPPTIIYLLFRPQPKSMLFTSMALCGILFVCMFLSLNAAFTGGGDMDAMKPFLEEHVICFVPMKPGGAAIDIVKTTNPVHDLFYYVMHNPFHFLKLMGLKLLSFFNITRSYYTTVHNIYLALIIIPVYLLSIPGLVYITRHFRSFSIFLISLLILYPLGATFQCDDWHSRFTMVIFPFFILLSCLGLFYISGNKNSKARQ